MRCYKVTFFKRLFCPLLLLIWFLMLIHEVFSPPSVVEPSQVEASNENITSQTESNPLSFYWCWRQYCTSSYEFSFRFFSEWCCSFATCHYIPHAGLWWSTRQCQTLGFLKEFHCNLLFGTPLPIGVSYHLLHFLCQFKLCSSTFFASCFNWLWTQLFFHQAVKFPHCLCAMDDEIHVFERVNTWTLVPLPSGRHTIESKWVYHIKYKPDGIVDRYKVHLVAKVCSQQEDIDYSS